MLDDRPLTAVKAAWDALRPLGVGLPEAQELGSGAEAAQALAEHLGVPFHFASPDVPDDEAPRRRRR
ncbi:hypothetical protein [Streptomyces puniciscabiei]|uniref:hypothetical protein n=1 Tax=Streptomyces puniciscabiei TaxID=164348 RepID=UPI00378FC70E